MKNTIVQYPLFLLLTLFLASCAKPIADFSYSTQNPTAPVDIQFSNNSERSETYEWDFGDGEKSTEEAPVHQFKTSGTYTVRLKATKGKKSTLMEKQLIVDAPEECYVLMETEFGNLTILLYDATPQHRDNFLKLVEEGFYDDLLFHRVMNGFMIQGGDPKSKNAGPKTRLGSGGPGYQIPAEFVDTLAHVKGALAAARIGGPSNPEKKSSGSQFYIVQGRPISADQIKVLEAQKDFHYTPEIRQKYMKDGGTPLLDREYTVFGQVVDGLEVIDEIASTRTNGDPPNGTSRPLKDVKMKIIVIK